MTIEDIASHVVRLADWAIVGTGSWLLIAWLILVVKIEK